MVVRGLYHDDGIRPKDPKDRLDTFTHSTDKDVVCTTMAKVILNRGCLVDVPNGSCDDFPKPGPRTYAKVRHDLASGSHQIGEHR